MKTLVINPRGNDESLSRIQVYCESAGAPESDHLIVKRDPDGESVWIHSKESNAECLIMMTRGTALRFIEEFSKLLRAPVEES